MSTYRNYKKGANWKNIILTIIAVALVATLAVTLVSAFGKKSKDADGYVGVTLDFSIGGLKADGTYLDTDATLYTKEAVTADDVKVTLEFDSNVQYQLYFYDEFDNFISSGTVLGKGSESDLPEGATCFRIVLIPIWDTDVDKDDQKVTLFNKLSFTKQITVSIIEPEVVEEPDAA